MGGALNDLTPGFDSALVCTNTSAQVSNAFPVRIDQTPNGAWKQIVIHALMQFDDPFGVRVLTQAWEACAANCIKYKFSVTHHRRWAGASFLLVAMLLCIVVGAIVAMQ